MRVLPIARTTVFAACVALSACADPAPAPAFTNLDYVLATSSGALSGLPIRLVTAAPPAPLAPPFAYTCDYDVPSKMFVCPVQSYGGGTFHTAYQLLDAGNQPLTTRDTAAAAAIRTVRTSDFSVLLPGDTVRYPVHNGIYRTLTGLLDGDRVVNSQDTIVRLIAMGPVQKLVTEIVTVTNFRPRTPGLPSSFPESGTITVSSAAFAADTTLQPLSALMTFNGGATVTWTRTFNGVTTTCSYNYATGVVATCV